MSNGTEVIKKRTYTLAIEKEWLEEQIEALEKETEIDKKMFLLLLKEIQWQRDGMKPIKKEK